MKKNGKPAVQAAYPMSLQIIVNGKNIGADAAKAIQYRDAHPTEIVYTWMAGGTWNQLAVGVQNSDVLCYVAFPANLMLGDFVMMPND